MMEINILNEKEFVKKCLDVPLQTSEIWYTINARWWKKWKRYVDYSNNEQGVIEHESPGPIDNYNLIENDYFNWNCLIEFDYEIIPEPVWKMLSDNYGLMQTDATLFKRYVIEECNELRVELFPLKLNIFIYGDDTNNNAVIKEFSCMSKIVDVEKFVESACHIPDGAVYQLIQEYDNGSLHAVHYASETTTLSDAGFRCEQKLFVDVRNSEGEFAFKDNRSNYTNSQGSVLGGSSSLTMALYTSPCSSSSLPSPRIDGEKSSECLYRSGVCGLANLGNTCFMNSAIQCISNVPVITNYFLDDNWTADLNKANPLGMEGRIATAYANLIREMWSGKAAYSFPRDFKYEVAQFAPQFCGYSQHDSQELMMFLLDGLHEDLNRVTNKPYIEQKNCASQSDQTLADDNWQYHLKRNNSIIVDYFHGQLKSRVVCPDCNFVSVTFDPFASLSLPLRQSYNQAVLFSPIDPRAPISQLSVSVYKNSLIGTLRETVQKQMAFNFENELLVAHVKAQKVVRFLQDGDPLASIPPSDQLIMYEVAPLQPEHAYIDLVFRDRCSPENQSMPLVIQMHRRITWPHFLAAIRPHLPRFLSDDFDIDSLDNDFLIVTNNRCHIERQSSSSSSSSTATTEEIADGDEVVTAAPINPFEALFSVFLQEAVSEHEINPLSRGRLVSNTSTCSRPHIVIEWTESATESHKVSPSVVVVPGNCSEHSTVDTAPPDIEDCLQLFLGEEFLGDRDLWFCPHCKRDKAASKKLDIWRLPRVLVLHLKRFKAASYFRDKINSDVLFPIRGLNLSKYMPKSVDTGDHTYDLVAVSNHVGCLAGGHYFAYAKNCVDGCWYKFDDSSTSVVSEDDIVTKSAYVLVYVARSCVASGVSASSDMEVDADEPSGQ